MGYRVELRYHRLPLHLGFIALIRTPSILYAEDRGFRSHLLSVWVILFSGGSVDVSGITVVGNLVL